jgi:hypothetical protein
MSISLEAVKPAVNTSGTDAVERVINNSRRTKRLSTLSPSQQGSSCSACFRPSGLRHTRRTFGPSQPELRQ